MSTPITAIAISHPATNESARRRPFDMLSKRITVTTDTGLVKAIARPSAATSAISVPTALDHSDSGSVTQAWSELDPSAPLRPKTPRIPWSRRHGGQGNPQPEARWLPCRRCTSSCVRWDNWTAVAKIGVLVAVIGIAFALPARAHAVDHVVLDISPTRIAAPAVSQGEQTGTSPTQTTRVVEARRSNSRPRLLSRPATRRSSVSR